MRRVTEASLNHRTFIWVAAAFGFIVASTLATTMPLHAGQAGAPQAQQPAATSPAAKPAVAAVPYRNQPARIAKRAAAEYEAVWGIEAPSVKVVESGVIIRFSYRVVDPEKARPLSDKKNTPYLVSPEKGVQLVVPTMEKVGQLRQAPHQLEAGKSYWMAFSNAGRLVKPGDRVDVEIGPFHARGLLVE